MTESRIRKHLMTKHSLPDDDDLLRAINDDGLRAFHAWDHETGTLGPEHKHTEHSPLFPRSEATT